MVSKEEYDKAIEIMVEFHKQNGVTNTCLKHTSWPTAVGHNYCVDCDIIFDLYKCKICDGTGRLQINQKKEDKTDEQETENSGDI